MSETVIPACSGLDFREGVVLMKDHNIIRIILADDHKLFRNGILSLLKDYNELYIVEEAENGKELVDKYMKIKPDVVLADISMPVLTGIEATEKIRQKDESCRVLFLSMFEGKEYIYMAWKAGALGMINKNVMTDELIYAIKKVYNHEYYFGMQWDEKSLNELIKKYSRPWKPKVNDFHYTLTRREEEILTLINDGYTSSEIAGKLNLSKRTVDSHRSNIMEKLNIHSLPELLKFAVHHVKSSDEIKN